MNQPRINRIEVPWHQFFKRVEGLQTAPRDDPLINEIVVLPEIIPIVFVPGIMGSRLKNAAGKKAWDPDAIGFMGFKYGLMGSATRRKTLLVGEQSHKKEYLTVHHQSKKAPESKKAFGWGGVAWNFYGGILQALAEHQWPQPLDLCFKFPVYAFGYNWSASNHDSGKALARKIEETIEQNNTWTTCKQVILVTHSMGGLVARSACKLHGAEDKVLGVVHGTQPATGAPAAYQRIKQGFTDLHRSVWDWFSSPLESLKNKVSERVLGPSGQSMTIVMANMPGGLELLPNQLYRTNDGRAQWLTYNLSNGRRVELPEKDPYREIYAKQHEAFRLVNPAWLGDEDGKTQGSLDAQRLIGPWRDYTMSLNKAKTFHNEIGDYVHPESYQFYSTGLNTADTATIASRKYSAQELAVKHNSQGKTYFEIIDEMGNMVDPNALWMEHVPYIYGNTPPPASSARKTLYAFAIEPPVGSGDGTVPDSSARALDAKPESYTKGPDGTVDINEDDESRAKREHSTVFSNRTAQQITLKAIENLCKHVFNKQTAR